MKILFVAQTPAIMEEIKEVIRNLLTIEVALLHPIHITLDIAIFFRNLPAGVSDLPHNVTVLPEEVDIKQIIAARPNLFVLELPRDSESFEARLLLVALECERKEDSLRHPVAVYCFSSLPSVQVEEIKKEIGTPKLEVAWRGKDSFFEEVCLLIHRIEGDI